MISTKDLVKLSGVTSRTLRHYDKIGLLKPKNTNESMRYYDDNAVFQLQQILFHKSLGMSLSDIAEIMRNDSISHIQTYQNHIQRIDAKMAELQNMKRLAQKEIEAIKKGEPMKQKDRFEAFKQDTLKKHDEKYKQEVLQRYGQKEYDESRSKVEKMDEKAWNEANEIASEIIRQLIIALNEKSPTGEAAKQAFLLHKKWISMYWGKYSPQAHLGLAQMYVEDERFKSYYDQHQSGLAEFLKLVIEKNIAEV